MGTGIIGFISQQERTQVSVSKKKKKKIQDLIFIILKLLILQLYVFNGLCWVTSVFSLFQLLSGILHVEPYLLSSKYSNNAIRVCKTIN